MLPRPGCRRCVLPGLAVLCVLLLGFRGAGTAGAEPGATDVTLPAYGQITVARLPATLASTRQARRLTRRLPAGRVRNAAALPADASVYVGVRRRPRSRRTLEALVAVLLPQPAILAAAGARPAARIGLRVPRGVRLRWGRGSMKVGAFSGSGAPRALCAVRLRRGKRMRARLVAGPALSYPKGSPAKPSVVIAQSLAAACGRRYDRAFRAAVDGGGRPGLAGGSPSRGRFRIAGP